LAARKGSAAAAYDIKAKPGIRRKPTEVGPEWAKAGEAVAIMFQLSVANCLAYVVFCQTRLPAVCSSIGGLEVKDRQSNGRKNYRWRRYIAVNSGGL
jgi:hypothetical protein